MRNNQPVTQREFDYADDATLMSLTDTQSHITYANAAFAAVSGYERKDLIGEPHNIVRHSDMPAEAFADLWRTLQGGESWSALVKNRRMDGDHYWVRANVSPLRRDDQLVGYMSVQTLGAGTACVRGARGPRADHRSTRPGPARARNVTRPAFGARADAVPAPGADASRRAVVVARTGTDDWEAF